MKGKIKSASVFVVSALISLSMCGCIVVAPPASQKPAEEPQKAEAGKKYTAEFNGHSYEFVAEDMTWPEAREACIKRGGHLVTVTSQEEQEYLKSMFLNINGSDVGGWLGAYSDGAYGGEKNDWRWVTGEQWVYTNWDANEPSNSRGEEWFAHFWKEMTWNDVAYDDPKNSQFGYICEYDDLQDETQEIYENDGYVDEDGNEFVNGGEDYNDESEDWDSEVQGGGEDYQMDPYYEDLGDDRTAIRSPWRGVQIKYPSDFYAEEDGEALRVFDGEYMYVYARNITAEALEHSEDMAAFCAAKAEEQAVADFTKLFGIPTGTDRVTKRAGDGDKRICDIKGNMFNDTADMWFKSKVFISGKNNDFIVIFTAFWRLDDQVGSDHYDQVTVTSWGRGEMYYQ